MNIATEINFKPLEVMRLSLKAKNLKEIPSVYASYKNVEHLDLSYNALAELPEFITKFKNLKSIDLSGNQHLQLPSVLLLLSELPKLRRLNLTNCHITRLPAEIYHLSHLRTLILDYNPMDVLNDQMMLNLPEGITQLSIRECTYCRPSQRLSSFQQLKEITLSFLDFDYLKTINLINRQVSLRV